MNKLLAIILVIVVATLVAAGPNSENYDTPRNPLSVNVPLFFDMLKTENGLGINVLSGLVRVDRGQEASRSGLEGRRPLSVRIFGVPIFERGVRRDVSPDVSKAEPLPPSSEPDAVPDNEVLTNP